MHAICRVRLGKYEGSGDRKATEFQEMVCSLDINWSQVSLARSVARELLSKKHVASHFAEP